jgi:hypothetical protein
MLLLQHKDVVFATWVAGSRPGLIVSTTLQGIVFEIGQTEKYWTIARWSLTSGQNV